MKSYWNDLKNDLHRPESWLDLTNQILRRVMLVLVLHIDESTGETWWGIHYWPNIRKTMVE